MILDPLTVLHPTRPKVRVGRAHDGGYVIAAGVAYDHFLSGGSPTTTRLSGASSTCTPSGRATPTTRTRKGTSLTRGYDSTGRFLVTAGSVPRATPS